MAIPRDLTGTRRDLLVVFSDGKRRAAQEAARELGRSASSIFGSLRRIHADGLITADSDPDPPTRGALYEITHLGRARLAEALAEERPVGQLSVAQWTATVERSKRGRMTDFQRIIGDVRHSGAIAWAATIGWGWWLVFEQDASEFQVTGLLVALEEAGFRCRHGQPNTLLSGAQLREQAATQVGEVV